MSRKIVISEFLSVDGVMEDPGGAEGFRHGGWALRYPDPGQYAYKRLMVFPVVLGSGKRLFGERGLEQPLPLRLARQQQLESGTLIFTYERD